MRIAAVEHETSQGKAKELLDGVRSKLGFAPNLMKTLARSPNALEAYLNFEASVGRTLNAKLREQIALVTAESNGCGYCASAHTALGKMAGLTNDETLAARAGIATDAKHRAVLEFTTAVIDKRGKVSDEELERVRNLGVAEAEIVEIVANVALNVFTNYINNVAETEIDFPVVELPVARTATV